MAIRSIIRRRRRNRRGSGNAMMEHQRWKSSNGRVDLSRVSQSLPIHGKEEGKGKEEEKMPCLHVRAPKENRWPEQAPAAMPTRIWRNPPQLLLPHLLIPAGNSLARAEHLTTFHRFHDNDGGRRAEEAVYHRSSSRFGFARSCRLRLFGARPEAPGRWRGVLLAGPVLRFPPPPPRQGGRRPRRWAGHGVLRQRGV